MQQSKASIYTFYVKLLVLTLLINFCLISCKRNSASSSARGNGVLDTQVALSLPKEAIGFAAWRTDTEGFAALKKAGLADTNSLGSTLKQLKSTNQTPEVQHAIEALIKSGLVSTDPTQTPVSEQGVFFLTNDNANPAALPTIALYLSAANGQDLSSKSESLKSALKELGAQISDESGAAGTTAFLAKFTSSAQSADSNPFTDIHFRLNKDLLAAAANASVADHLFQADAKLSDVSLSSNPDFAKLVSKSDNQIVLGFLDAKALAASVKSVIAKLPQSPDSAQIEKLPFTSASFTRAYDGQLHDQVKVSLKAQVPEQQTWIDAFNGDGAGVSFDALPSDVLFALSLDGKVINNLVSAASKDMPDQQKAMVNSQLANISELREVSIAVRQTTSPLPIPDIFILARNSQASQLRALIKTAGAAIAATQGASTGAQLAWTSRTVGSADVDVMVHPIGVGVFMTSDSDSLIIASSEKAISDVLDVKSGKTSALSSIAKTDISGFLRGFMDFQKLASMIEGLQANLAVLTGGKSNFDTTQLDSMKKLGTSSFAVKSNAGTFELDSRTQAKKE